MNPTQEDIKMFEIMGWLEKDTKKEELEEIKNDIHCNN